MEAADFEGLCVVGTVQGVFGDVSGSLSLLVFASQSCFSLALPPAAQLALIRGVALCWGVGFATAIASGGGDATAYAMSVKTDAKVVNPKAPPPPKRYLRFYDWDKPTLHFEGWDKGE